jgi:hypothetical protein
MIVEWYRSVNSDFFSGFLTAWIFIFGTKLHLILLLKEKIYDTEEYYLQQLRRENEENRDHTKHLYDKLRNLNHMFLCSEYACVVAALGQYILPYIDWQPYMTYIALVTTVICLVVVITCVTISGVAFTVYLKGLKDSPVKNRYKKHDNC